MLLNEEELIENVQQKDLELQTDVGVACVGKPCRASQSEFRDDKKTEKSRKGVSDFASVTLST
jgi:hypothetical protein